MSATTWEQQTKQVIHNLEAEKLDAERRVQVAQDNLAEKAQQLERWYRVLKEYRELHDLPSSDNDHSPILEDEYARLGPTEIIHYWANRHEGEVILKDLVKTVLRAGVYRDYKQAYNTLTSIVRRNKGYERVAPGHFRSRRNSQGMLVVSRPSVTTVFSHGRAANI